MMAYQPRNLTLPAPSTPPRLSRVGDAPRPYSAPPTPTPQGNNSTAQPNAEVNGRHKSKSWLGKLIKKLSHNEESVGSGQHWHHRRNDDTAPTANATNTTRNRPRATTPPAGARHLGDRTPDRDPTQRRRSTDARAGNSSNTSGNRDRERGTSGAMTARSSRRSPADETGPDGLCLFFIRGECPNGRLCPYRHPGEETLFGLSPRTIVRTIRRAMENSERNGNTNRSERSEARRSESRGVRNSGEGTGANSTSDRRAERRRHSTGTGTPSGSNQSTSATPARPRTRTARAGLSEIEIEMLPSFPFRPLSEAEAAEPDHRQTECQICLDDFEEGASVRALPCFHVFHAHCVGLWLKKHKTCPFCQTEVKLEAEP